MCWAWIGLLELPIDPRNVRRGKALPLTLTDYLQHLPGVHGEGDDREAQQPQRANRQNSQRCQCRVEHPESEAEQYDS